MKKPHEKKYYKPYVSIYQKNIKLRNNFTFKLN